MTVLPVSHGSLLFPLLLGACCKLVTVSTMQELSPPTWTTLSFLGAAGRAGAWTTAQPDCACSQPSHLRCAERAGCCWPGEKMGQSVVLRHWVWEDGTAGGPDAPVAAITQAQVEEAQAAVVQQVRREQHLLPVRARSCLPERPQPGGMDQSPGGQGPWG